MKDPQVSIELLLREAMEVVTHPLLARLAECEARLGALEARHTDSERRCVSVDEACERWGFSRSSWDRWLADRASGLREVVIPAGSRVLVPVSEFEGWMRARRDRSPRR